MKRAGAMLDMKVSQLTVDPFTNMPIIILKDEAGHEALPIWIGLIEASAIATELEKIALDRPMTHDLMKNIIGETGLRVDRVEVHDVRDNTFYATIFLVGPKKRVVAVDSRPSDAIALALRTGARICVAKKVIERTRNLDLGRTDGKRGARTGGALFAGGDPEHEAARAKGDDDGARLRELLESLSDDEFGKWKM
jgi:bifunctional DNase/RNase